MRSLISKLFFPASQVGEHNGSDYPVVGCKDATF